MTKYLALSAAAIAVTAGGSLSASIRDGGQELNIGQDTGQSRSAMAEAQPNPASGMTMSDPGVDDAPAGPEESEAQPGQVSGENGTASQSVRSAEREQAGGRNEGRTAVAERRRIAAPSRRARADDGVLRGFSRGVAAGCPPRFADRDSDCTLPAASRDERPLFGTRYTPAMFGYSQDPEGRYTYADGYLLRLGENGSVAGYLPLPGGALAPGRRWPDTYRSYPVPGYYVDYYGLGGPDYYRYADDVIYRIDPETSTIQSVAALLTGDTFTVGEQVPDGYEVYNVPYPYREEYRDTAQSAYRYADGHIYRVDRPTGTVTATIDLLI